MQSLSKNFGTQVFGRRRPSVVGMYHRNVHQKDYRRVTVQEFSGGVAGVSSESKLSVGDRPERGDLR